MLDRRVLLVEDGPVELHLLTKLLQRKIRDVYSATNGVLALEMLRSVGTVDLIITDISMPLMTGFELIAEIRKQGFSMPVVALSAHSDLETRTAAERAGFRAVLVKPISKESLNMLLDFLGTRL